MAGSFAYTSSKMTFLVAVNLGSSRVLIKGISRVSNKLFYVFIVAVERVK